MFNSQRPSVDDLPTSGQLFRATAVALVAAGAILVTVVLPAEYAIDPTGAGRALGFTQMGEVKAQLAAEAAADAIPKVSPTPLVSQSSASANPVVGERRSDVTTLTLAPGEGAEIKAKMAKGASLQFDWSVIRAVAPEPAMLAVEGGYQRTLLACGILALAVAMIK